MTRSIYWIRHGYSRANHLRDSNPLGFLTEKIIHSVNKKRTDPSLTAFGISQAQMLNHVPLIQSRYKTRCCSASFRAIQTAYHAFPRKKIYVVPYVHETGSRNVPQITNNSEYLLLKAKCSMFKNINWSILDSIPKTPELGKLSWYLFKHQIIPKLPKRDLIIVSHSKFIKKHLGRKNDVINCGVYSSKGIEFPTPSNHAKLTFKNKTFYIKFRNKLVPYKKYYKQKEVKKYNLA